MTLTSIQMLGEDHGDVAGLRILGFCDYYGPASAGGSERVAREVTTRLVGWGAHVTVATAVSGSAFADRDVDVHVRERAFDVSALAGAQLTVSPGYTRWAIDLVERLRPQVLYAQSLHFHSSVTAARVSRRVGIPLVTVVHVGGLEHLHGRTRVLAEAYERTVGTYVLRSSTAVIAVGSAVAAHARARGAGDRVTVAANGVDLERFQPRPDPAGPPVITFVGRLVANKGPEVLLDASELLRRADIDHRVVVVGAGPLRPRLAASAAGRRLPVHFVGHCDDVAPWLAASHVVVRPSFTEGMPLAVLEAMASRRCVVASDIPAHRELLAAGGGLLHRPGDPDDLARALLLVIGDPDRRERHAARALTTARAHSWFDTARAHAAVLAAAARRERTS